MYTNRQECVKRLCVHNKSELAVFECHLGPACRTTMTLCAT